MPAKLLNLPLPCAKPVVPGDFQHCGGVLIPDSVQDPSRSSSFCCGLWVIQSPVQCLLSQWRYKWWTGAPAPSFPPAYQLLASITFSFHPFFFSSLWSNLSIRMFLGYSLIVLPIELFSLANYSYLNFPLIKSNLYLLLSSQTIPSVLQWFSTLLLMKCQVLCSVLTKGIWETRGTWKLPDQKKPMACPGQYPVLDKTYITSFRAKFLSSKNRE